MRSLKYSMNKILKDKSGFLLRDFVIAGLVFATIIALYVIQVASVADNYDNTDMISQDFADHYDKLTTNKQYLDTSAKAVQNPDGGLNLVGTFNVAFNSVFTVIVMIWDSLTLYATMGTHLPEDFKFLDYNVITILMGSIIAILTTYLIFVWLSSVTRGKL